MLDRIETGRRVSIERVTFPAMVADGGLYAMPTTDYWLDLGRPEPYLAANLDVLDGRRAHLQVAGVATGAQVDQNAHVQRSVVAATCVVARDARLTDSVLLAGVRVGEGAVVVRSILGPGTVVGAGAHLTDVVTGAAAEVAPGSRHRDCRIPEPD